MSEKNLPEQEAIPAVIRGGDKVEQAEVTIQNWSPRRRLRRALTYLAVLWGLAILSLPVPILHFILVPLLFLAGLIVPYFVYRQRSVVLGGAGSCPFCGKPFQIARTFNRWPLRDVCSECHRHVVIERAHLAHER